MPKLSSLQIFDKIEERLRDLDAGKQLSVHLSQKSITAS